MQSSPRKVKGDLSWPSLPKCFPITEMETDGRVPGPLGALSVSDRSWYPGGDLRRPPVCGSMSLNLMWKNMALW